MALPNIPPELWCHIFQFLSTADEVTDSSSDAWANIVTANPKHTYVPSRAVIECNEAKRAVGLVCKDFYELSRPVVLETITLWNIDSMRYLARQIREKSEIARVVERSTKRIDFRLTKTPFRRERQTVGDVEIVINSSRNLTCLKLPDYDWHSAGYSISDVVSKTCTLLDVLYYPQTLLWPELPSTLNSFNNLRVLDLTAINDREVLGPCEFPLLHTLIGSLDVVCSRFADARLPSLRTLVFKRLLQSSFDIAPFFQCHGKNIESLDMSGHAGLFERRTLELLPNVRDVVMDVWDRKAIGRMWPNVQKFGICNLASSRASSLAATVYSLGSIHLQRVKGNYPNLRTIRILDGTIVRLLRERNSMAAHYERGDCAIGQSGLRMVMDICFSRQFNSPQSSTRSSQ
ncbi:hypothetical protein ACEPAH_3788 [Sanghuangporus vaninii]